MARIIPDPTESSSRILVLLARVRLRYCLDATIRPPLPAVGESTGEGDRRVPFGCGTRPYTLTPALSRPGRGGKNERHCISVSQNLVLEVALQELLVAVRMAELRQGVSNL